MADYTRGLFCPEELRNKDLPIGTTRYVMNLAGKVDVVFTWVLATAAAAPDAATFTFYGSTLPYEAAELKDTDPSTNPHWVDQTPYGAAFPVNPGTVVGSSQLTLGNNALSALLIEIDVTSALTGFTFSARGQARA